MSDLSLTAFDQFEGICRHYATATPAVASDGLAELAEQFIAIKRHLGHRYHTNGRILKCFLEFMSGRGVLHPADLSLAHMTAWASSMAHLEPLVWMRYVTAVSVFFDHLRAIGLLVNNPCSFLRRRGRSNFRPHIFSTDELRRIFALASKQGPVTERALVYLVLYACGLRASEATNLQVRHLDEQQGTIFIAKTKFNKQRLLPLHARLLERLIRFRNEMRSGAEVHDPLFVNANRRQHDPAALSAHFRDDLKSLGIFYPKHVEQGVRYGSPRLHSLRHSFAVHRLLRWYQQGEDVQTKLPLLSTYLGHGQVRYTQVYLKITGLLLREGHKRFADRFEQAFPLEP